MSDVSSRSELPPTSELVEGLLFYPVALVISATVCPGLTLCVPGLIFVAVLILIPLVAMAIVLLLAAAVVAAPVVAVRGIRALGRRRAASKSRSPLAVGDAAPTVVSSPFTLARAATARTPRR